MRSEIRDGVYTGRPAGPFTYREGKAEAIREVAARDGFDLSESYAYSDSESDLPMLRAVGHPVAVNPDAALLRVAREEGWQVVTFDRLHRRMRIAAAVAGLATAGAGGGYVVARLRPSGRERLWRSLRRR
jgi:phosphoserine phosphatase